MDRGRTAIIGGGIAGLTAAWQLARLGATNFTLFEASGRLGGTVETVRRNGFTIELGPDGWVSEKPWARELAVDLGLEDELIGSSDADRVTYLLNGGKLVPIPDGMRLMVPGDLRALDRSPLFSREAKRAFAAEPGRARRLRAAAPAADESVSEFVARHFGAEVLTKVGAPLLSGVFGGDVRKLSVRAVMPQLVKMEREHGSLILGLQAARKAASGKPPQPVFTSLRNGVGALLERLIAQIPGRALRLATEVTEIRPQLRGWMVGVGGVHELFDELVLAVPAHVAAGLLRPVSAKLAGLLPVEATSAVLVALAFEQTFTLPKGFGFLVPAGEQNQLLAGTFVDQKFPSRSPKGTRLLRGFFGGAAAAAVAAKPDAEIAALTLGELERILGSLPAPSLALVRRWPRSLPQYAVGHPERVAELDRLVAAMPGLTLLGNAYRGVGLPDVVRDARAAARRITGVS